MIALIIASAIALVAYGALSYGVRRKLTRDRRSDDPLRRAHAVDRAVIAQVAAVGHAIVTGLGVLVGVSAADLLGGVIFCLVVSCLLGVPVSRWERRRLREICG